MSNSEEDNLCTISKDRSESNDNKTESQDQTYDPLYFCRTCANKDSFFVPIFQEEGLNHQLHQKIEKYLPIHVTRDDDLPLQLCYSCASTIIAWDMLIIGCIDAEKKLKSLKSRSHSYDYENKKNEKQDELYETATSNVDSDDEPLITQKLSVIKKSKKRRNGKKEVAASKIETPESQQESENEADREEKKNLGIGESDLVTGVEEGNNLGVNISDGWEALPKTWMNALGCKFCGKEDCSSKHEENQEEKKTCGKNFECSLCQQRFTKKINLEKHIKKHEREKVDDSGKRFTCGVCNKKFKFEDNGLSHEKLCGKEDSTFKCSVCGKRFETKNLADQHSTSHHKSCVCHMCGQSFNKPESLKQHIKTIHEEFKMVCHYCGREFTRKARLQEHLQHHTGQMDFTCHVCGKGSTNAYSFSVHLATHTQETPFSCSFCPRSFKHMKYVYLHERAVHLKLKSGKTYIKPKRPGKNIAQRTCPLCNKTFKRESAMLIHKRMVHEGKNGYICKLCGKDFKYTYLLYVHRKKHHFPELCKYVCQFCEKPFPVKTELEKHLRKHTGEKPYICSVCGKTYSFHGSLNMHIKTQHENNKNFKCETCDASFNFRSHLTRHMSAHAEKYPVDFGRT